MHLSFLELPFVHVFSIVQIGFYQNATKSLSSQTVVYITSSFVLLFALSAFLPLLLRLLLLLGRLFIDPVRRETTSA